MDQAPFQPTSPAGTLRMRAARRDEASMLAALSRDLIEAGLAWRYTPRRMRSLMADPDTIVLVAHDEHRLHGFAVMGFGDERAHLMLLCVQEMLQRRGTGTRLVDWLLKSARVAGIAHVDVEMRADNDGAQDFYASLGFVPTGCIGGYYAGGIDALRMHLSLD